MKIFLPIFFLLVSFNAISQAPASCDNNRYINNIFTDVVVTTDVKYGENLTFTGNMKELFMDIYEPMGDNEEMRPVVMIAFGGSFIGGSKDDVDWLCETYAQKGYVAVAIDYRLYDGPLLPLPNATKMKDVVTKSIGDYKAAIRFMREEAAGDNTYKIDSDNIYIGGISAGAIAAAHTAMLDLEDNIDQELLNLIDENGGIEGNSSDNYEYSSEAQGLINFSGGLHKAHWVDADDPVLFSVHDEFDGVVPYGDGSATIFGVPIIEMGGSLSLTQKADSVDLFNELITIDDSEGHVSYFISEIAVIDQIVDASALFMHNQYCEGFTSTNDLTENPLSVFPNPTNGYVTFNNSGEKPYSISIYNNLGMKVATEVVKTEINMGKYGPGMYYIQDNLNSRNITKVVVLK